MEASAVTAVFERVEEKYLLTEAQLQAVQKKLAPYFTRDQYGVHTILSAYYDSADFALVRASLAKPHYKEKLRLRSYGTPQGDTTVYLEIKKKYEGIVYKRRAGLSLNEARTFDAWGVLPAAQGTDAQIFAEIGWMRTRYALRPRAVLCCERTALFGSDDPELRITFDADMRWRAQALDLANGSDGTPLRPGQYLMEVKVPGAYPLWLARILSEEGLRPVGFSKYGTAYEEFMAPQAAARYSAETALNALARSGAGAARAAMA